MDRKVFFDALRPHLNLTTQNVFGTEKILDYAYTRETPINDLAYILATAWWETAQTMHPVEEAYWVPNADAWRKRNLRYYPWHGRGLIQTTWKANYRTMGERIGMDLIADPEALLDWPASLPALFIGMDEGLYTGKDLDDFIDDIDEDDQEDLREFANARRIVNGTDKQVTIGKIALQFKKALRAADYEPNRPTRTPPPPPDIPKPDDSPSQPPQSGFFHALLQILRRLFP